MGDLVLSIPGRPEVPTILLSIRVHMQSSGFTSKHDKAYGYVFQHFPTWFDHGRIQWWWYDVWNLETSLNLETSNNSNGTACIQAGPKMNEGASLKLSKYEDYFGMEKCWHNSKHQWSFVTMIIYIHMWSWHIQGLRLWNASCHSKSAALLWHLGCTAEIVPMIWQVDGHTHNKGNKEWYSDTVCWKGRLMK